MTAIFAVAGAVVALMAIALFDTGNPLVIAWILLTGGTFVFIISLIIGHYMAEPLVNLHRRAQAVFEGDATVDIKPEGKLYEADLLAEDFAALSE